jgi:hypothetical protein
MCGPEPTLGTGTTVLPDSLRPALELWMGPGPEKFHPLGTPSRVGGAAPAPWAFKALNL